MPTPSWSDGPQGWSQPPGGQPAGGAATAGAMLDRAIAGVRQTGTTVVTTVKGWDRKVQIGAAAGATLLILLVSTVLFNSGGEQVEQPPLVIATNTEPPGPTFETQSYADRGLSVNVPDGWTKTGEGVWVDYTDPADSGRRVRILVENAGPSTQPMSFLRAAGDRLSGNRGSCKEPYRELGLVETEVAGRPSAELEYTCGNDQERRHGIWRAVVANGKAYSFFLTTPDARFDESKPIFDEMVRSFELTEAG
jgi:eukaryotic-like serine/threonine-protein kinase